MLRNLGLVLFSLLIALLLGELILRSLPGPSPAQESMDPGLIRFDPRLGWALSPDWQGEHRHEEFTARYQITATGNRISPDARLDQRWRKRTLWLGDSMSFGLGVNDADTFINLLNQGSKDEVHLNYAVPGYSTDQQVLLLERLQRTQRFDRVVLVSYLANDLVDNARPSPCRRSGPSHAFGSTMAD